MKIHFSSPRGKTKSNFSPGISRDRDSCQGLVGWYYMISPPQRAWWPGIPYPCLCICICICIYFGGSWLVLNDISATTSMVAWYPISMSALAIVAVAVFTLHAKTIN